MERSTYAIIGDRYLDTQHDSDYIESLEVELAKRNVTGIKRWLIEYGAASALWWNFLWWEWCDLDERDIKIGWVQNIAVFSVLSLLLVFFVSLKAGIIAFLIQHLLSTLIGFGMRQGSKK